MALKLDWRDLIYFKSRKAGYGSYEYLMHLEEAFTACIGFIKERYPNATLNHVGSDLGGEKYKVEEKNDEDHV